MLDDALLWKKNATHAADGSKLMCCCVCVVTVNLSRTSFIILYEMKMSSHVSIFVDIYHG